jgi:hypothetical protein
VDQLSVVAWFAPIALRSTQRRSSKKPKSDVHGNRTIIDYMTGSDIKIFKALDDPISGCELFIKFLTSLRFGVLAIQHLIV